MMWPMTPPKTWCDRMWFSVVEYHTLRSLHKETRDNQSLNHIETQIARFRLLMDLLAVNVESWVHGGLSKLKTQASKSFFSSHFAWSIFHNFCEENFWKNFGSSSQTNTYQYYSVLNTYQYSIHPSNIKLINLHTSRIHTVSSILIRKMIIPPPKKIIPA